MTFFDDVKNFTKKFKLEITHKPSFCNDELMNTRLRHLSEELSEIKFAVARRDLAETLDGLVDLVYVALGTAANMNLPFNVAWNMVHWANMKKIRATKVTKRGSTQDVVKPKGWKKPDIEDLVAKDAQKPRGIIVVEGPDHCGKTTLCNTITKKYDAKYLHATFPYEGTSDVFKYHLRILEEALELSKEGIVLIDRLWPSEVVYGSVYRKGNSKPGYEILLDRIIRKHGGIYIFCLFSHRKDAERLYQEKIQFVNSLTARDLYVKNANLVLRGYKELFYKIQRHENVYSYHFLEEGIHVGNVCNCLVDILKRSVEKIPSFALSTNNVLGNIATARYLLVGDRYSTRSDSSRPFFGLDNCSKYLLDKMQKLKVSDHHFAFTNINEERGSSIASYCSSVRRIPIIALGDNAFNGLAKLGISAYKMKHPQWYRRFDYHGNKLVSDIKKIM